jgi:hypothetical protein
LAKAIFYSALVEGGNATPSEKKRRALNEKLAKKSGEPNSRIDWNTQQFCFVTPSGGLYATHPWKILEVIRRKVPSPTGPPPMSDHEAFLQRVLTATCAVWRDDILAEFDRKAAGGSIKLYGRLEKTTSPFVRVAPDIWLQVEVHDWINGNARAADATDIWSIHSDAGIISRSSTSGRKPTYDQSEVNGEVKRRIKEKGFPLRNGEPGWQSEADLQDAVANFLRNTTGKVPVKSTLQRLVKNALICIKAEADN